MASMFPSELHKGHPDVLRADRILEELKDFWKEKP
jgi:hypothetical protein